MFRDEFRPLMSIMTGPLSTSDRRTQAEQAFGPERKDDVLAIQALCQWYNGETEAARTIMETLEREFPESVYVRWARQVRETAP